MPGQRALRRETMPNMRQRTHGQKQSWRSIPRNSPEVGVMEARELTTAERTAIKNLVTSMCANYDGGYKLCLPLDCACVMLQEWWMGSECKYFKTAILPLDNALESALTGGVPLMDDTRPCVLCGKLFSISSNRAVYCPDCSTKERKKRQRGYMRKKRGRC